MKSAYLTLPINTILVFLLAFLLSDNITTYEVTGRLVDRDDNAVTGHGVLLLDSDDHQIASGQSNDQGHFVLTYQVEVTSADPFDDPETVTEFRLGSSYPNPFNPVTTVPFHVPEATQAVIGVYDILGRLIMESRADVGIGTHHIEVNLGGRLSQGQYLLRVRGEGFALTQAMTFISAGVSSGTPQIILRSGAQVQNHVSGKMGVQNETKKFRVVVEDSELYAGKTIEINHAENIALGTLIIDRKITEDFTISGPFALTVASYADDSDWSSIVNEMMGQDYRVADWNDLVAYHADGHDLINMLNELGVTERGTIGSVTRDGNRQYSSTRYYFASRHDHNRPSNYLAHSNIDNHLVSLGSWDGDRRILAYNENYESSQEPLTQLPGDEEETVVNVTFNLSAPSQATEENVSTISVGEVQQRIVRTEIEVAIDPDATTRQVNELLEKFDAKIVDMLAGREFLILQIPDPGDVEALNTFLAEIENEEVVQFVSPSTVIEEQIIEPPHRQKIPSHADISKIEHHLGIRGHAAWNLRNAIKGLEERPWIVIADEFGHGVPGSGYNANFIDTDFGDNAPNDHGYHVLGIITALFDSDSDLTERKNHVTGIFPESLNVRAIDIKKSEYTTWNRVQNQIIAVIEEILQNENDARIILNTSLNTRFLSEDDLEILAFKWIGKVRGSWYSRKNLDEKYIHFTSAGNVRNNQRYPAKENSIFNFAALEDPKHIITRDRLKNTFVVENRVNTKHTSEQRPVPGCANDNSIMGGNISAMGTDVFSFGMCFDRDSEGKCILHFPFENTGTSMSTPQAAGVAAYVWAVNPELSVAEVMNIMRETAEERPTTSIPADSLCNEVTPQPVVDAYAAVLAAGGMNARRVLLDVTETGTFDEADIEKFLKEFEERDGALDYSRYDLNGDGKTGGDDLDRFDLNHDMEFGTVSQTIEDENIEFDENKLTDLDILCYYAYSDLYEGDVEQRTELLEGHCFEDNGDWPRDTETEVVEVTNPATGQVWMDRNLGASRAAASSTDSEAYGDLYQWGRGADGHQRRNSSTTSTWSSTDQPGHDSFITSSSGANWDWRNPQNDNLWQGLNGVNNPCPAGYRLPTEAEWNAERNSWSSNNAAGAYASPLKLPMAGGRSVSSGSLFGVGSSGHYWAGTVSGSVARAPYFNSSSAYMFSYGRAFGRSVRCTKDEQEPAKQYTLSVSKSGQGTVTSNPSGINIPTNGTSDSHSFNQGTEVTLTASPSSGWRVDSWGGACSGSGTTCKVTMSQNRSVSVAFEQIPVTQYTLSVSKSGQGTVTSNPSGINIPTNGTSDSHSFNQGTEVTLTASPSSGWRVDRWEGACSGSSNICIVNMSQNLNASVIFKEFAYIEIFAHNGQILYKTNVPDWSNTNMQIRRPLHSTSNPYYVGSPSWSYASGDVMVWTSSSYIYLNEAGTIATSYGLTIDESASSVTVEVTGQLRNWIFDPLQNTTRGGFYGDTHINTSRKKFSREVAEHLITSDINLDSSYINRSGRTRLRFHYDNTAVWPDFVKVGVERIRWTFNGWIPANSSSKMEIQEMPKIIDIMDVNE